MQSHQQFYYPPKAVPTFADQVGDNYMNIPVASAFGTVFPPCAKPFPPLYGIEFQPSEVCPKNFVIFNQTDHRNQIMFNPAVANNLNGHGLNGLANYMDGRFVIKDVIVNDEEKETSSSLKEVSYDIDSLLSSEEDEQEDYDEEEVSTARTYGIHESDSDSCSAYGSKPRKNCSCPSPLESTGSGGFCDPEKRLKMKKMVKVLRGIVPGADEMGTVAVLDEAVRYLKSLKVEAKKLGVESFMNGD